MGAVADRVRALITQQFPNADASDYRDSADIITDLGGDSLDAVEIKLLLELEFDRHDLSTVSDMRTVGDIIKFMEDIENGQHI